MKTLMHNNYHRKCVLTVTYEKSSKLQVSESTAKFQRDCPGRLRVRKGNIDTVFFFSPPVVQHQNQNLKFRRTAPYKEWDSASDFTTQDTCSYESSTFISVKASIGEIQNPSTN